ncbi:hypothetical protein BH18ACT4_BH18ACT4_04140 [soil metagenome]
MNVDLVPRRITAVVVAVVFAVGACGDDKREAYSVDTETQFMATCVASVGEGERSLCGCIYDSITEEIPFEEFEELDRRLNDDPDAELPERIDALVVECATNPETGGDGSATTSTTAAP